MAIFAMARACALAMAELRAVHTAAIRSRVPHGGTAADRTGFAGDRVGSDRPNALHGEQRLRGRRVVQTRMDGLVQGFDLVPQTVQPHEPAGDRPHRGLVGQQGRAVLLRPLVKPFDAEACPGMPRHDVWHPEDLGGVLTDHRRTIASPSTDCPCGLGIHIPLGEHA